MLRLAIASITPAQADELFVAEYNGDRTQYPQVYIVDTDYLVDDDADVEETDDEVFVIERDEDGDIVDGDYHEAFKDEYGNLFIVDSEYDFMF